MQENNRTEFHFTLFKYRHFITRFTECVSCVYVFECVLYVSCASPPFAEKLFFVPKFIINSINSKSLDIFTLKNVFLYLKNVTLFVCVCVCVVKTP